MSLLDHLATWPQYVVPHHLLSTLVGRLADSETNPLRRRAIRWFARRYRVDMTTAVEPDLGAYPSFNAFFTRALRADARPIRGDDATLCSPCDGAISEFGAIRDGRIVQAKGRDYSLLELLGGDAAVAARFDGGHFCTIYLSPRDYHRFHLPCAGTLTSMIHVPGRLFSVNPRTARVVPRLFARNERVVALFDTAIGPVALVAVGAMIVGSVETVWSGVVTPPTRRGVAVTDYPGGEHRFARGDEIGRFRLGSTIVAVFPAIDLSWDDAIAAGASIEMGAPLATVTTGV